MGFASHYANIALYIHIKSSDFFPVLIFCILLFPHPSSLSCLFLFIRSLLSLGTFIRQTCVQPLFCTQRCAVQQIGCSPCLQGVLSLDREPGSLLHVARACRCDGSQEAEAGDHRAVQQEVPPLPVVPEPCVTPCYTRSHQPSVLCTVSVACICQPQPPSPSTHRPLWSPHVCSPRLNFLLLGKRGHRDLL